MKRREFILVLSVVAVVAMMLAENERKDPIPETEGERAAISSSSSIPVAAPSPSLAASEPLKAPNEWHASNCDYESEIATPPLRNDALVLRGEDAFKSNCALCHGVGLKGDGYGGRSLNPSPADLNNSSNYKYGSEPENIFHSAMYGIGRTGCAPWDGIITPNDMWAIAFYIESRQRR